jgi:uncharacterized protein (TIGR01777 family)
MSLALISGGSGLIGSALARLLLSKGHQVVILTRDAGKQPDYGIGAVWDGIHPGIWMDWVQKADWIINLAGENIGAKPWTSERWQIIRESRVFTGELLAEAVLRSSKRPSAFLQMSAIGYYGVQSKNDTSAWDESTPSGTDRLAAVCRDWEKSSARVEEMGLRRIVMRTGLVLAKDAGVLPKLELPFKLFAGGPMGSGKQVYSWIHLDDLVHAMVFLLEEPKATGAFNLTAPEPVSNGEFSRILGHVLHRPSWLPVPEFALKLILGEMSTLILDGQRIIPNRLQKELGYQFKYPTLQLALSNLHPDRE